MGYTKNQCTLLDELWCTTIARDLFGDLDQSSEFTSEGVQEIAIVARPEQR